jgi:DNA helicase IV
MASHPDHAEEQAFIDYAYTCLDHNRDDAWKLRELTETGRGGTNQARWEAEVFEGAIAHRLNKLELRDAALVFGRIDRIDPGPYVHGQSNGQANGQSNGQANGQANGQTDGQINGHAHGHEAFHIGRLAVSDAEHDPVVIDWRAPVAEPFYRATGREPMGLARRRHFVVKGAQLLGIEDELFGEGHLGIGDDGPRLSGHSTLIAALESGRTGQLGDIVATIQGEQDEIIRSGQSGVLVVQGGPGTGKTVVALHRAAYLLYTNRFPLEDQGVLVIGPNRLFLRYIERVLPSLGEAGVEQVMLADLVHDVQISGSDQPAVARVKGDVRMSHVLSKAVRDRQRPLRADIEVPFGASMLRFTVRDSEHIVTNARRRFRRHNAARKFVETEFFAALAASARGRELSGEQVREKLRQVDVVRAALERMWPVLTPAQFLHDLYGSTPLLKLAGSRWLSDSEYQSLARPRRDRLDDVVFTLDDVAVLDEARALLGPRFDPKGHSIDEEEIRTYGHIVVDEVQDLTPMQLRMCERRSLNGSMTVVGDLGQATGPHAPDDWDDVLKHLPDRKDPRITELTVGYRIPAPAMDLAARVLAVAAPKLHPPRSVRSGDGEPVIVAAHGEPFNAVVNQVRTLTARAAGGTVAVVAPASLVDGVVAALHAAGIEAALAVRDGIESAVSVVPVSVVKGLELDGVVVVDPARIVAEEPQGLRSLYVALTRATRWLSIVVDGTAGLPPSVVDAFQPTAEPV